MYIKPDSYELWLRIKLQSPLSHHDPGQQDKSNKSLFRRQAKFVQVNQGKLETATMQFEIENILQLLRVPAQVSSMLQSATLPQFLATAIINLFIAEYGSGDGTGLFSGIERYKFLEERFCHAAIMSSSLLEMWGLASKSLLVPPMSSRRLSTIIPLLTVPGIIGGMVLKEISDIPRVCTMLARMWNENEKTQNLEYAKKAGVVQGDINLTKMSYDIKDYIVKNDEMIINIPHVSANTLRHQLIREPIMWHLFNTLEIPFDAPHPATVAMFYNGGDIKSGSKRPSNVFWLTKKILETYPSLGLLSGSTDSFILGEGALNVHAWIICQENNDVLEHVGLNSGVSIFKLLDDWYLTRQAGIVGTGQMPYSFEAIVEGAEILVRISLSPYATLLQKGALMAALSTYEKSHPIIGGQAARGFGLVSLNYHIGEYDKKAKDEYDLYLMENKTALRDGILNGTFCTGKDIIK